MNLFYLPFWTSGAVVVWYIVYFVIFIAVFIGVFLLLRNFWCWYFKINKVVSLLEEQNRLLARISGGRGADFAVNRQTAQSHANNMPEQPPSGTPAP